MAWRYRLQSLRKLRAQQVEEAKQRASAALLVSQRAEQRFAQATRARASSESKFRASSAVEHERLRSVRAPSSDWSLLAQWARDAERRLAGLRAAEGEAQRALKDAQAQLHAARESLKRAGEASEAVERDFQRQSRQASRAEERKVDEAMMEDWTSRSASSGSRGCT